MSEIDGTASPHSEDLCTCLQSPCVCDAREHQREKHIPGTAGYYHAQAHRLQCEVDAAISMLNGMYVEWTDSDSELVRKVGRYIDKYNHYNSSSALYLDAEAQRGQMGGFHGPG